MFVFLASFLFFIASPASKTPFSAFLGSHGKKRRAREARPPLCYTVRSSPRGFFNLGCVRGPFAQLDTASSYPARGKHRSHTRTNKSRHKATTRTKPGQALPRGDVYIYAALYAFNAAECMKHRQRHALSIIHFARRPEGISSSFLVPLFFARNTHACRGACREETERSPARSACCTHHARIATLSMCRRMLHPTMQTAESSRKKKMSRRNSRMQTTRGNRRDVKAQRMHEGKERGSADRTAPLARPL